MNKFDYDCWSHYGIDGKLRMIITKQDELIEGYNEVMKIIKGDNRIMENIDRIMEDHYNETRKYTDKV